MSNNQTATRRLSPVLTALAVIFAIGVPTLQALIGWGLGAGEFAADGQSTLRAASYAFSIWTIIYIWLALYAFQRFHMPASSLDATLSRPALVAIAGCGLWIIASAADQKWATIAIILISATLLVSALVNAPKVGASRKEQVWIIAPLALLAGWLTIATALNTLTVLTALGFLAAESAPIAAAAGIAVVSVIGIVVGQQKALWIYPLPIAWGLAAVTVAELESKPAMAMGAAAAAVVLILAAFVGAFRKAERNR